MILMQVRNDLWGLPLTRLLCLQISEAGEMEEFQEEKLEDLFGMWDRLDHTPACTETRAGGRPIGIIWGCSDKALIPAVCGGQG